MAELPKILRIGYQRVQVIPEKSSMGASLGQYNTETATIKLNLDYPQVEIINTLIHEALHAVWHNYGLQVAFPDEDGHELIVTTMANGLTQVFRDNPDLLEWVRDGLSAEDTYGGGDGA